MLTIFQHAGRFGLRSATVIIANPEYDAVWPLPFGFWGLRRGNKFGVRAADGTVVCPEVLPGFYYGFAALSTEDEVAAFLEPEASFVPFMRQHFPELHRHYSTLCQPATWPAEDITPHLLDYENELWLRGVEGTLLLSAPDCWQWSPQAGAYHTETLYFASGQPADFQSSNKFCFEPAEVADLLRWRLRMLELCATDGESDAAQALMWDIQFARRQHTYVDALEEVLAKSGIRLLKPVEGVDIPFYHAFELHRVAPEVRQQCEVHFNTVFEVDADSMIYVEQLIYLAWLWANGYVFYDPRDGMHWIDDRYEFDNSLFDNHIIDNIHMEYDLDQIIPLLRLPTATSSDTPTAS